MVVETWEGLVLDFPISRKFSEKWGTRLDPC